MHPLSFRPVRAVRPAIVAILLSTLSVAAASAAKGPAIKVDDDPRVGAPDAPLVVIEFGHHL